MFNLNDFELSFVSGGDRWGYESSDGSLDEDRAAAQSASYGNSPPPADCPGAFASAVYTGTAIVAGAVTTTVVTAACTVAAVPTTAGAGTPAAVIYCPTIGTAAGGAVGVMVDSALRGASAARCPTPSRSGPSGR
jgi:hypothetical protein